MNDDPSRIYDQDGDLGDSRNAAGAPANAPIAANDPSEDWKKNYVGDRSGHFIAASEGRYPSAFEDRFQGEDANPIEEPGEGRYPAYSPRPDIAFEPLVPEETPKGWALYRPWILSIAGALIIIFSLAAVFSGPSLKPAGPFPPPVQTALDPPIELLGPPGFKISAVDEYYVEALVVSKERYYFGREADFSPVDFLLAWGPVTVEPNLSGISFSQGGRWGHWNCDPGKIVISRQDIEINCSNHHIIPSETDPDIRTQILKVRRGDVVRLKGYLVRIESDDGWRWNTSRSRTDTAGGACEILYVTEIH